MVPYPSFPPFAVFFDQMPLSTLSVSNGEEGREKEEERTSAPVKKHERERDVGREGPGPEHAAGQAVLAGRQRATKLRAPLYFRPTELRRPSAGRPDTRDSTQIDETNLCSRDNFV